MGMRGAVSPHWRSLLVIALTTLALVILASSQLAPRASIGTYVHGKSVDAWVQVFALLPPGSRDSIVEVWNGSSSNGIAEMPLLAL